MAIAKMLVLESALTLFSGLKFILLNHKLWISLKGGLIQNQQMVFLMNSFLTPALYFLDGGRLFKKLYKWWVIKHKDTCTMTQA